MNIGVIFGQMLVLLVMMLVGCLVYRWGWLNAESAGRISKLVVNVFNPVLVVNSVLGHSRQEGGNGFFQNIGFVFAYFVILILFSTLIPRSFMSPRSGVAVTPSSCASGK